MRRLPFAWRADRLGLRWSLLLFAPLLALVSLGCPQGPPKKPPVAPEDVSLEDVSAAQREAVLKAHYEGVGAMEQFRYADAVKAFRVVRSLVPGWVPAKVNLAIALLNDVGLKSEESKKSGTDVAKDNFTEALELLDGVIAKDPNNLTAYFCRGVILQYLGEIRPAHKDFQVVVDKDPSDGHAWFRLASTLEDPDRPGFKAGLKQHKELVRLYEESLRRNPHLFPAYYQLFQVTGWAASDAPTPEEKEKLLARQKDLQNTFQRLHPKISPTGTGESGDNAYGQMGKHGRLLGPEPPRPSLTDMPQWPKFEKIRPIEVELAEGTRWAKRDDFQGDHALLGRVRARFGAAVAAADFNGDGHLDLYLTAAVVRPSGLRDVLLLNKGDHKFEDASERFGLPDRPSMGVALGDFDADKHVDVYLTATGDNRLLRNRDGTAFEDVTDTAGVRCADALSITARWLDIDQDGDLDLYVVQHTKKDSADQAFLETKVPGMPNAAFRNDGAPTPIDKATPLPNLTPEATATSEQPGRGGLSVSFTPWPDAADLLGGAQRHTAVAALDLDDDRDLDLVLAADDGPLTIILNERLGRFSARTVPDLKAPARASGLVVADIDADGRADLVATNRAGDAAAWRNTSSRDQEGSVVFRFEARDFQAANWSMPQVCDLNLDGLADFMGVGHTLGQTRDDDVPGVGWTLGDRRPIGHMPGPDERPVGRGPEPGLRACFLADLVGDPLPDLLTIHDGGPPQLMRNLGNGNRWLALELGGRWKFSFDQMRTNPHGLGARLAIQAGELFVPFDHTTQSGGLGQSIAPIVVGLGPHKAATLVHVNWPDGVMQTEMNVPSNQLLSLAEYNRKTGSCPVLFAWDGKRFACVGDFLGGGGLGYLVAPGTYGQPDRDEAMLIGAHVLRAENGSYRLRVLEPMDEVAYLDQLCLDVIDTPRDLSIAPDERFAPGGNRPTGSLLAWRTEVRPLKATDLKGRDVTARLAAFDRLTVDDFRKLGAWVGYTEEHGIVLDFGDQLSRYGPEDRLVLGLAGWVEYPYSQTNYAAATAGVALKPPVLERLNDDGSWSVLEPDPGYPAGLPRLTTLELTGKLAGPRCVLRLRTNMECYWDHAFVAILDAKAEVRVTTLDIDRATLSYRGPVREVSPDGRMPALYEYETVEDVPLARFRGHLTKLGDVRRLLTGDDDHLCVIGPGDDLEIRFAADQVPPPPEGWTRRFVLRTVGYCKDADPFTAGSDDVGPLPYRAMPAFPFPREKARPIDQPYKEDFDTYQVRPAERPFTNEGP